MIKVRAKVGVLAVITNMIRVRVQVRFRMKVEARTRIVRTIAWMKARMV